MYSADASKRAFLSPRLLQAGERLESAFVSTDAVVTHTIEEVESIWRRFSARTIESPGQSYDFIRLWVADRKIAPADQCYVVGRVDGEPVALMPLHRKRVWGLSVLTWFAGVNANCHVPIADHARLAALGSEGRAKLWKAMLAGLKGADAVFLRSVPAENGSYAGLFGELGEHLATETLYRSHYASWEECDRQQRNRSRRKHDRQQGDRLAALGAVDFEQLRVGDDMAPVIETMFRQRSARFKAMGIRDLFVLDGLVGFYQAAARPGSGIDVRLHVLRLDGAIVAVRYNIVHGGRMFCLISSMSDDPAIQQGSPGKQCLLRVMQSVFDEGIEVFDMGSGFTDEKRHWCNIRIPLRHHYVGLSARGKVAVEGHRLFERLRAAAKANSRFKAALRSLRHGLRLFSGRAPAKPDCSD